MDRLKRITLVVTTACQLRCRMCGQVNLPERTGDAARAPAFLDFDLAASRLDDIPDMKFIHLFGGEPLLHPDLFSFVEYAAARSIKSQFSTNGLLLEKHARRIAASGLSVLSISLDSHVPSVHDAIRGRDGLFDTVLAGLGALFAARRELGRSRPLVKVHFTITPFNFLSMVEYHAFFMRRFPELDMVKFHFPRFATAAMATAYDDVLARHFGVLPKSHKGNFSDPDLCAAYAALDTDALHDQVERVLDLPKTSITGPVTREGIERYFRSPEQPPPGQRCGCFESMAVLPGGDAVNCADYPDIVFGNIREQGLSDIWQGDKARAWREYLAANGNPGVLAKCSRLYPAVPSRAG